MSDADIDSILDCYVYSNMSSDSDGDIVKNIIPKQVIFLSLKAQNILRYSILLLYFILQHRFLNYRICCTLKRVILNVTTAIKIQNTRHS